MSDTITVTYDAPTTEQPTGRLRWVKAPNILNPFHQVLEQEFTVTTFSLGGTRVLGQEQVWKPVPVEPAP